MLFLLYRYAEGAGNSVRFSGLIDIDFLSPTELICTDSDNHCLRVADFKLSPPQTSTFAGICETAGNRDGRRENLALFQKPRCTAVNNDKSTLFVLDDSVTLRMIDLESDDVMTVVTFDTTSPDIKLFGNNLYFPHVTSIAGFDLDTKEESIVAGGTSSGNAFGSFEETRFNNASKLLLWRDDVKVLLLVVDYGADRFVGLFLRCTCMKYASSNNIVPIGAFHFC